MTSNPVRLVAEEDEPDTPQPRVAQVAGPARRPEAWVVVSAAALALIVFLVIRKTIIDDVYITLSYARNLVEHGHWGLTADLTSNSATSPLNVGVLGLALLVFRNPVVSVGVVFVGSVAAFAWLVQRTARALDLPVWTTPAVVGVTVLNPLLASIVGMEISTLGLVVIGGLLVCAVEGRPRAFGVVAGLAVLVRLDLVIIALALLIATPALRRRVVGVLVPAVCVSAPWYVFSWIVLGSAIPDTLAIKQAQVWPATYATGPRFFVDRDPVAIVLGLGIALLGLAVVVAALVARRRFPDRGRALAPVLGLGIGGVAYVVAYVILAPPPYVWYYEPPILALGTSGVLLIAAWVRGDRRVDATATPPRGGTGRGRTALAALLVALLVADVALLTWNANRGWDRPPVAGNVASPGDYERIGKAVKARIGDAPVAIRSEIGALAYSCNCRILDGFSDRAITVPLIQNTIAEHDPISRAALKVNYAFLDRHPLPVVPAYYLDTGRGPAKGPDQWSYTSLVTGRTDHLTLHRDPATRAAVDAMLPRIERDLPKDRRIVLHTDTGGDPDIRVDLWLYSIASELRRDGYDVAMHYSGMSGVPLTVATSAGVGRALFRKSVRSSGAYVGKVTLAERIHLEREANRLTRLHRQKKIGDVPMFVDMVKIRKQIDKREVLVYRGAP